MKSGGSSRNALSTVVKGRLCASSDEAAADAEGDASDTRPRAGCRQLCTISEPMTLTLSGAAVADLSSGVSNRPPTTLDVIGVCSAKLACANPEMICTRTGEERTNRETKGVSESQGKAPTPRPAAAQKCAVESEAL